MQENLDRELDRLFERYRASIPEIDGSPRFLQGVWQRIEAERRLSWLTSVRSWSPRVAAAAGLAAAVLTAAVWFPEQARREREVLGQSYLETLTVESLDEQDAALWTIAGDRLAAKR